MSLSQDWSYILPWPSFVHLFVSLSNCAQGSDWMESVIDSRWLISQQSRNLFWTPQQPKASLAGHQQLLLLRICLNNIAKPKLQLLQPALLLRICVEQHCKSKASYCNQQCSWGSVLNNITKPKLPLQSAIFLSRGSVWTTLQNRSLILHPAKMLRICVEQHSKTKAAASIAINNPFQRICFGTT